MLFAIIADREGSKDDRRAVCLCCCCGCRCRCRCYHCRGGDGSQSNNIILMCQGGRGDIKHTTINLHRTISRVEGPLCSHTEGNVEGDGSASEKSFINYHLSFNNKVVQNEYPSKGARLHCNSRRLWSCHNSRSRRSGHGGLCGGCTATALLTALAYNLRRAEAGSQGTAGVMAGNYGLTATVEPYRGSL